MAGLAQASRVARRRRPVGGEELDQRAGLRIGEAALEQVDQRAGAAQPVLLGRRDMQREQRFEQMHVRVLPARQLHLAAPRRELLEEAAVARIGEVRLHRLPGRVGKLDRARVMRRAEIPGEREQHEGVVVGVARIVERRALGRDRAKPAAVRRARGADQKRKAVARGLAERRIAVEHIGVAEHVSEPRLHQRRAARAPDRAAQRVDLFGEAAGRIGDALQPERADVFEQPRPQRAQIVWIEHRHVCAALPRRVRAR